MNSSSAPTFVDDNVLLIGGIEFFCDYPLPIAPAERLTVMKQRRMVERCIRLADELAPQRMVELGIKHGGSVAMWAELTRPEKLVAVELGGELSGVLRAYIDTGGLVDVVRPYFGVDQADLVRIAEITDNEFGTDSLDLVFDDASHLYVETRASFEFLFPKLRPGGVYVIEDWSDKHLISDGFMAKLADQATPEHDAKVQQLRAAIEAQVASAGDPEIPLTQLAVELVIARASRGDIFRSVAVEADWIIVTRGADPIGPEPFRLSDHVHDHEGFLPIPGATSFAQRLT